VQNAQFDLAVFDLKTRATVKTRSLAAKLRILLFWPEFIGLKGLISVDWPQDIGHRIEAANLPW